MDLVARHQRGVGSHLDLLRLELAVDGPASAIRARFNFAPRHRAPTQAAPRAMQVPTGASSTYRSKVSCSCSSPSCETLTFASPDSREVMVLQLHRAMES